MAKLLYEDEWMQAMSEEDGFKLIYCLVREPRLLTLQYKGRNALHLAMRHNWYGLVQEIFLQFKHLYDSGEQSGTSNQSRAKLPAEGEEDETSSQLLDVNVLRDLLTCKEGTSEAGSSGLDVLAMAVIQCHQGINTLLVRMISNLPNSVKLFADHTYLNVASCSRVLDQVGTEDTYEPDSESWRNWTDENLEKSFPNLSDYLKLDHAPNMWFDDRQIQTEKGSRTRVFDLDPQTEPAIYMWMLTSPFLCLSEHLILDYCCNWSKPENLLSRNASSTDKHEWSCIQRIIGQESSGVYLNGRFSNYLFQISDTRRTVLHYAALDSSKALSPQAVNPFLYLLSESCADFEYMTLTGSPVLVKTGPRMSDFSKMKDSSGRTVGHLLLAVEPPTLTDIYSDNSFYTGIYSLYSRITFASLSNWDPLEREVWTYDGWKCSIQVDTVHRVNDYAYYQTDYQSGDGLNNVKVKFRTVPLEQIIYSSPYLTETGKMKWLRFLTALLHKEGIRKELEAEDVFSFRPSVHAGVTSDVLLTPLQLCVLLGYNTRVKKLAQDDQWYDHARFKNQLEPEEYASELNSHDQQQLTWLRHVQKSVLQFAAERADPGILRIILGTGKFDIHNEDDEGNTLLHAAVNCEDATFLPFMWTDFVEIPENSFGKLPGVEQSLKAKSQQSEEERLHLEGRRQGCVNLLLQEGLDIWETNNSGEIADPGSKASPDYSSWWYEKLTLETQDQKVRFSAAATAISVTAALVATASYVGPLQPPLGYSWEDVDQIAKVQAGVLPVRVFFVCNTLAFYLAVAAVVLSLTPSLPMPHESTTEELKRIRRCVTWALLLLIVSLIAVLSAFASASVVVIPNGGKWNHGWLTGSGVVVGCIVCIAVLILCCTRAVKLVCHNNRAFDRFYRRWVYI